MYHGTMYYTYTGATIGGIKDTSLARGGVIGLLFILIIGLLIIQYNNRPINNRPIIIISFNFDLK